MSHHHSEPSSKDLLCPVCPSIIRLPPCLSLLPCSLSSRHFGYVILKDTKHPPASGSLLLPWAPPEMLLHRHPWLTSLATLDTTQESSQENSLCFIFLLHYTCCHLHRIYCVCCPFPLTRIQPWGREPHGGPP